MLHAVSISHTLLIERGALLQLNIEKVVLSTEKNKSMLSMYSYIRSFVCDWIVLLNIKQFCPTCSLLIHIRT